MEDNKIKILGFEGPGDGSDLEKGSGARRRHWHGCSHGGQLGLDSGQSKIICFL